MMTQSKGGNGAFILGLILFVLVKFFGRRLWKYRIILGILLLMGIVFGSAAIVAYGRQHERLPGGNSMLVRWHTGKAGPDDLRPFLTGVGGGNFGFLYPRYKTPAASKPFWIRTMSFCHCSVNTARWECWRFWPRF